MVDQQGRAYFPCIMIAEPSASDIANRARTLWEQSGCPEGRDLHFWLEAESELRRRAIRPEIDELRVTLSSIEFPSPVRMSRGPRDNHR